MKKKDNYLGIEEQYALIAESILEKGLNKHDRTGTGTKSIFSAQIVHDMQYGFPLLTTKRMHWKSIVVELMWFLKGRTDLRYLVDNGCNIWNGDAYKAYQSGFKEKHYLKPTSTKEEFIERIKTDDEFAKKWGDLGPIYGKQWRRWKTDSVSIDQIQDLISELKTNPDSRRLMVNAWNVSELDQMTLPPCHWAFELYTEELTLSERTTLFCTKTGQKDRDIIDLHIENLIDSLNKKFEKFNIPKRRLSLKWHQRSVDLPLGLPFNIASYGLLLSIIAKEVNMIPGILVGDLTNVHIYNNQIEGIKTQLEREPRNLPELVLKDSFWELCETDLSMRAKTEKYSHEWFTIEDYTPHPSIKIPLSN